MVNTYILEKLSREKKKQLKRRSDTNLTFSKNKVKLLIASCNGDKPPLRSGKSTIETVTGKT